MVEDIHAVLANLTVALIAFHILGVLLASFEHRENLVKSMITGQKRASYGIVPAKIAVARRFDAARVWYTANPR